MLLRILEMSQRVEKLIDGEKIKIKTKSISDEDKYLGIILPPWLQPLRIGMRRHTIHYSEADNPSFYIPIRRTKTVERWTCSVLRVVANPVDVPVLKIYLCGIYHQTSLLFYSVGL